VDVFYNIMSVNICYSYSRVRILSVSHLGTTILHCMTAVSLPPVEKR
jgi:hypothetical protein